MPTKQTTDAVALKLSSGTILLLKVYTFKGFYTRIKLTEW